MDIKKCQIPRDHKDVLCIIASMDFQFIARHSEEIYLAFLLASIFYNMILFPYLLKENFQILSRFMSILFGVIGIVLTYKLNIHLIKVRKLNDDDDIPINELEKNNRFMERIARAIGFY